MKAIYSQWFISGLFSVSCLFINLFVCFLCQKSRRKCLNFVFQYGSSRIVRTFSKDNQMSAFRGFSVGEMPLTPIRLRAFTPEEGYYYEATLLHKLRQGFEQTFKLFASNYDGTFRGQASVFSFDQVSLQPLSCFRLYELQSSIWPNLANNRFIILCDLESA